MEINNPITAEHVDTVARLFKDIMLIAVTAGALLFASGSFIEFMRGAPLF